MGLRSRITSRLVHNNSQVDSESTERQNIEVWNDLVSPRDLLICLAVSVTCAVAAVLISLKFGGQPLFWGLGAAVIGFAVNCFLVTPKRSVVIVDELNDSGIIDDVDADSIEIANENADEGGAK